MMMGTSIKLSELNEFISCPVCHGYLIDATTVNECLHTFCKSCIVKHIKDDNNECPKCNTVIHERRPLDYIIQDRIKQDIVYKLVPQLYISELERKRTLQDLPKIDSINKLMRGNASIHVVLVQKRRNNPIDPIIMPATGTNKSAKNQEKTEIYLKCPIDVKVYQLRKLIIMKFQLKAYDRVSIFYKGDIVTDFDHVSNLAQSLTFCLQYEISRMIKAHNSQGSSTSISSYESASTSSSLVNSVVTTATTATIGTSTTEDSESDKEMVIDESNAEIEDPLAINK